MSWLHPGLGLQRPSHALGLTEHLQGGRERALGSEEGATRLCVASTLLGDLDQIPSLRAWVSPLAEWGCYGRVLGCIEVQAIFGIRTQSPYPTPLPALACPESKGGGLGEAGIVGTRGLREVPPPLSAHRALLPKERLDLFTFHGSWIQTPTPGPQQAGLRKGLGGCPTQRGADPSTWQPLRTATEGGWFQPPRAVSMVTGTEPSWAFEEHS